jgi:hypothetical protein
MVWWTDPTTQTNIGSSSYTQHGGLYGVRNVNILSFSTNSTDNMKVCEDSAYEAIEQNRQLQLDCHYNPTYAGTYGN